MQQEKQFFRVLLIVFTALFVFFLAVVLPITLGGDGEDSSTVSPIEIEGEGEKYGTALLYGPFTRAKPQDGDFSKNIYKITIHNKSETYSFVHPTQTNYTNFVIEQNGKTYSDLQVNPETLANIVVGAGTVYVRVRVEKGENAASRYAEFGLADSDDPKMIELTLYGKTLSETGETYRVYIGDKTSDGSGYFARVAGRDVIYVTNTPTLGDLLEKSAGSYVASYLTPELNNANSHYFADDFRVVRETRDHGDGALTALENMTVSVTETVTTVYPDLSERVKTETNLYKLNDENVPAAIRAALIGQTVGVPLSISDVTVDTVVPSASGNVTIAYCHHFSKINYVSAKETAVAFSYIPDPKDRDFFTGGTLYKLEAPSGLCDYTASDDTIMAALNNFQRLTGVSTYKLGVTEKDVEELGLYTTVTYRVPMTVKSEEGSYSASISALKIIASDYVTVTLRVSEKQADGTYYVASDYYDVIAVVDGTSLGFLEYDLYTWVKPNLVSSYMQLLKTVRYDFDYTDFSASYLFDCTRIVTRMDEYGSIEYFSIPLNGKAVSYDAYESLYYYLLFQSYSGECELSDAEREDLCQNGRAVFTMTFTLTDGRVFTYRFLPYSAGRSLVEIRNGANGSAFFYVPNSLAKTMAADLTAAAAGLPFERDEKYR